MTRQEAIQAQIDEIMDTFEFEDVHRWMQHDGWGWGTLHTMETEVPDPYEIKRCARQRLKEAAESGYSCTGGFTAIRHEGEDDNGPWIQLDLMFGYRSITDGTSYSKQ